MQKEGLTTESSEVKVIMRQKLTITLKNDGEYQRESLHCNPLCVLFSMHTLVKKFIKLSL